MKLITKNRLLFYMPVLICGVLCMLLRFVMMLRGFDSTGLLVSGHPSVVAAWGITAAYLVFLLVCAGKLGKRAGYEVCFPRGPLAGTMMAASGLLISYCSLTDPNGVMRIMGMFSGVCMMIMGWFRFTGKRPSYLTGLLPSVYFVLQLIFCYRAWSTDPQLQDYAFQILSRVAVMIGTFHITQAAGGSVSRRALAFSCFSAGFFSLVSISDPVAPVYYGACCLWALGGAGSVEPEQK